MSDQSEPNFPNETPEYRAARQKLLQRELELRRLTESVAASRRALPLGGKVPKDYVFECASGPIKFSDMFGEHDTLFIYHSMFGVPREEGQNPRGVDPIWPLWNLLDYTPDGRGANWGAHDHDTSLLRYDGG